VGACLALYLAAAIDLVLIRHAVLADAMSRVAGSYFALYSRDPHLATIGFVRMPLPSLLTLPLLPFKAIFPALTQAGFAANILSALFMAGAVVQLHAILLDAHVERRLRLALTALFALQPMLIYTGANGSSEAILLFFLLVAARALGHWLAHRDLMSLVLAGFALAGAYLTGPEALPAAAGATLLVVVTNLRRESDSLASPLRVRVGVAQHLPPPLPGPSAHASGALVPGERLRRSGRVGVGAFTPAASALARSRVPGRGRSRAPARTS
jgi:hypothetical protein